MQRAPPTKLRMPKRFIGSAPKKKNAKPPQNPVKYAKIDSKEHEDDISWANGGCHGILFRVFQCFTAH